MDEDDYEDENLFTIPKSQGNTAETPTPNVLRGVDGMGGGHNGNADAKVTDEKIDTDDEKEQLDFLPPPPSEPEPEAEVEPKSDPVFDRLNAIDIAYATEDDIALMIDKQMIEKLCQGLQSTDQVPQQRKYIGALFKAIERDAVPQARFIQAGGLNSLMQIIYTQMENGGNLLYEAIHFVGELSANPGLKNFLITQNTVKWMVQCMRNNKGDAKIVDACIFVLATLCYDHSATMSCIIELGAVTDVFEIMENHQKDIFVLKSCLDLLSNLMHNSPQNRVHIANQGSVLDILTKYGSEDSALCIKVLRCLGNLSYVAENVSKLVKEGIISSLLNCAKENHEDEDVLQMATAVLSNLASDAQVSEQMIEEGVLDVILSASSAYPDLIELQKSCLGCLGNLANNAQNRYTMIDSECGTRVIEVLGRLHFDDSIIVLALSLLKILAISPEVTTQFLRDGMARTITRILRDNLKMDAKYIRLCSQALCKCIANTECAEIAASHGVHDALCDVAKEGNNCYNAPLMIDIMKVFQNMSTIEQNAQRIARYASVPILRGMESMKDHRDLMNVSAVCVGNLAVYESASKHIVKRGGCAVLAHCINSNLGHQAVLSKLLRCIANLVLTEAKSYDLFVELEMGEMITKVQSMYPNHPQIQKNAESFLRSMEMRSKKIVQAPKAMMSATLKDKMNIKYVKFLISGAMMKKYSNSAKPKKRIVKLTQDLEYIILQDPSGKKPSRQINVRQITEMRTGACTAALTKGGLGWKRAKNERCFAIFTKDGSGKINDINLECKTVEMYLKWSAALQELINCVHDTTGSFNVD